MKQISILLVVLFSLNSAFAQYGNQSVSEVGVGVGIANYYGDLANNTDALIYDGLEPKAFRPAFSVFYRNNFSKWFAFRSTLTIGRLYGDDKFSNTPRNLHFRTNITDITLMMEWNILPYKIGAINKKFTPYIGVGLGGFFFNPKAELNGEWVNLQPLGTEGQGLAEYPNRTKYSKIDISIPMSFGLKWHVSRRVGMGIEVQYRYIFTDYLDDVSTVYPDLSFYENNYVEAVAQEAAALSYRDESQAFDNVSFNKRGNSGKDDAYFFVMFNLSYRLGQGHVVCPTFK